MNKLSIDWELEDGENLLWQGKPQQRCGVMQWWMLYAGALVTGALLGWSFTGAELPFWPGLCAFLADAFCRLVLGALTLGFVVIPSLAAYSTNASQYLITDRRIAIRKPDIRGGSYTDSYGYADMSHVRISPMPNGLASLSFVVPGRREDGKAKELLFAIPRLVAEDAQKLAARAEE